MFWLFFACTQPPTPSTIPSKPTVQTLSFPASYLVQRLAGDLVEENCILPTGEDSVFWHPSTEVISVLQQADLIVGNGAGFEKWIQTAAVPTSKLVLASDTLDLIKMEGKTHSHGKGGEHSHGETDPHTWSSPQLYQQQAIIIYKALLQTIPTQKEGLDIKLALLQADMQSLEASYKTTFTPLASIPFAANHPSYSYLARDYSLQIQSFDFDPEGDIATEEIEKYTQWRETTQSSIILWESEPSEKAKSAFPKGIQHVYIDPLEQPNGTYDYLAQAKANIQRFQTLTPAQ